MVAAAEHWRSAAACQFADPDLFFPRLIVRPVPGAGRGGEADLRTVPGPAAVPGVRATDTPGTRSVGRHERAGTVPALGT